MITPFTGISVHELLPLLELFIVEINLQIYFR